MRQYLYCESAGFVEKTEWQPNSWVNVVCPDQADFKFLTETLHVPQSFLDDVADTDERPRTEMEDNWLLTILRIPVPVHDAPDGIPFTTVPIGIMTNNDIIVSVCYYHTEMLPDFIEHTRRKNVFVRNKLDLILRLIYSSAVWFLKYLKQIYNDVNEAEKELERSIRNEDLLRMMRLQKTLVYFNTSISWKRSDDRAPEVHFSGYGFPRCGTDGRCTDRVAAGKQYGQHLQRHFSRGRWMRLHRLSQTM